MANLRLPSLLVACLLWSSAAFAQTQVGVRAGVSGDPGQFVFGGHVETQPLMPHLSFRPNVEIGVGGGRTLLAVNFEFVYSIRPDAKPWRVYLGAGPAAVVRWTHDRGGTDGGGGLNFLIGLHHDRGLFAEFKVGAIDSPSARFTVGYAFR